MVFYEHVFREATAKRIEDHVQSLRLSSPSGRNNINFRSTNGNTWWRRNPSAHQKLTEVANILMQPIPQTNKDQIFSTFMLVRNVRSIIRPSNNGRSYINRQSLHVNFETSPIYGEAFMQIIYYVDTPRYASGHVASPGNRGRLLVGQQGHARALVPERGHAVYFTPTDTWHEVLPQSNQNVNVDRKMIIMFLYKRTSRTNVVSEQIRNYHPNFPFGLQALAGVRIPIQTERSLASLMRQLAVANKKRRRPNTARTPPPKPKYRRTNNRMNMN
jgi:hypothetical protein